MESGKKTFMESVLALVLMLGVWPPSGGATITVDLAGSGDFKDIQSAIDAGDVNDGGSLDLTDAVYSLNFLFLGGDPPRTPFPECGIDPWIDALDCREYPSCK